MDMNNQKEEWKPVVGYEGLYEVSSNGQVRDLRSGRCSFGGRSNGHLAVMLNDDINGRRSRQVHVLVATAFLGRPQDNNHCIIHKDGNNFNNCVSNLSWVLRSDMFRHHNIGGKISASIRKWGNFKPVKALDGNNKVVGVYNSIYEATKKSGISAPSICRALKNPNWSAGGYRWILHEG